MDTGDRWNCGVNGATFTALAVGGLGLRLYYVHLAFGSEPDVVERCVEYAARMLGSPWAVVITLCAVAALHFGLFLCVKTVANPPRFWKHTARHLAMTSGLAWGLYLFLLVAFALIPK